MREEKQIVRNYYDTFGWQRDAFDVYNEVNAYVDTRPVMAPYLHETYRRVRHLLEPPGKYLLDGGSGALDSPEKLEYSLGYKKRICVDLSLRALTEARAKLKETGFYVVADLTHLPFREEVFDSVISAHVLYHIPPDEQEPALRELYRTLRNGGRCLIIYAWPSGRVVAAAKHFLRSLAAILRSLHLKDVGRRIRPREMRKLPCSTDGKIETHNSQALYAYVHNYSWFRQVLPSSWQVEIRCWRAVDKPFTTKFIGNHIIGRIIMDLIFWAESVLPHVAGRLGRYPLIVIRK
jgi:ubiquinone/menaquinone biosynthesis C-methylase UbiE